MFSVDGVSQATFMAACLAEEQELIARVDICEPDGTVLFHSTLTLDASVTEDATQSVLRRCNVNLIDPDGDLTFTEANDLLTPLGNELRIYRGLLVPIQGTIISDVYDDLYSGSYGSITRTSGRTDVWCPLGVFGISHPIVSSNSGGVLMTVDAYDRARRIQRALFTDTYVIVTGTDLAAAIDAALRDRWNLCPPLRSLMPAIAITHRAIFDVGTDPWRALSDLATAYGAWLYFDEVGVPTLRPIPDAISATPVASYERGLSSPMEYVERALDDESTYSGVLAMGESTSAAAPVRAVVWDEDPLSPTYRLGKFGQVPLPYSSPFITTSAQAIQTAVALLAQNTGVMETSAWDQVPNPALQAGDLVAAVDPVMGVAGTFSIESQQIGLTPGSVQRMQMKARRIAT